jgi:hypothetical protein
VIVKKLVPLLAAAIILSVPATALAQSQTTPNKDHDTTPSQAGTIGPTNTTSGGSPASSPQGDAPPGMQAAPKGNSQTFGTQTDDATNQENRQPEKK